MADVMKLCLAAADTIDFSPRAGYIMPQHRGRTTYTAMDGTLYVYEWGSKELYEVPVSNISAANFGTIKTWWENMSTLTFYADFSNASATTISVRIMNEEVPLRMMGHTWANLYEGVLVIRQR